MQTPKSEITEEVKEAARRLSEKLKNGVKTTSFKDIADIKPREIPTLQHKEAFCLMKYQDLATGEIEWLWNSRDGVTPFIIRHKDGKTTSELRHVDFHEDAFIPNFVPPISSRILTDKIGFDPSKDDFNLSVITVTLHINDAFKQQAMLTPWVPQKASRIVMPGSGRYA